MGNTNVSRKNMRECPSCNQQSVPRTKLFLQELAVPFVTAVCRSCESLVTTKSEPVFSWLLVELLFVLCLVVSVVYFFNIWFGIWLFIFLRIGKAYFKAGGKLET